MSRSPSSLIPSAGEQSPVEKRDDKALKREEGKANSRAVTNVNVITASSTPPTKEPLQLELFPGRACPSEAKPATGLAQATEGQTCRDGVQDDSTRGKRIKTTGETLYGLAEQMSLFEPTSKAAHKTNSRKRGTKAVQGVGGGHSTWEARESRVEGRAATSITRSKEGKAAGMRPRGKAQPQRMNKARKLQRTLYRTAKQQPERRFTLLYDKVCREDILQEAWVRVKRNRGAAGVDKVTIEQVEEQGVEAFLAGIKTELEAGTYRVQDVRRVHIPKPGQPGKTRPLGIPTLKDRVIQMAAKMVIEPLFEADFRPCSYGFRPKKTPRMALSEIAKRTQAGYEHVVDVDLRSYFDTIDHDLLMKLVERRVGDVRVLRLIRAWLKAGIMEDGKSIHPVKGTPQGGVISPLLSNIMLHEIDRLWCEADGSPTQRIVLVRYADDMVLLARTAQEARQAWKQLQGQFAELRLEVNQEKSRLATVDEGFAFLGFEYRRRKRRLYMWPRKKAQQQIRQRIREVVRTTPYTANLSELRQELNPVLIGWCTYFRVGNSNRVFHKIDETTRDQIHIWLRRKHGCSWNKARKRWNYRTLHETYRIYRMVGKVSYLEGLRRKPSEEGGRRAGCGKSARPVR
jgi:RNA-directed DNA polymerase